MVQKKLVVNYVLEHLKQVGVRVVFGIPGGLLHPFFDAVELDPELRLIVTKHEEGAAFMADGFARVGDGFAVAAATAGPGATNLLTGVSVAYTDGVPMLVITGQAPSRVMGKGSSQEMAPDDVNLVEMFRQVTKYSAMVLSPERFPHHLRRALRVAMTGRPGPVHLNVPVDFWSQEITITPEDISTKYFLPKLFDRAQVREVADVLLDSEKPVFLVGSGAAKAAARSELIKLAEKLKALVATTPRGKGIFPEDHELSLGVFGFAGHQEAKEILLGEELDLMFIIGASMNETTTLNWDPRLGKNRIIIQLDVDIDKIGRNYTVDHCLLGDAATVLEEMRYHVDRALERDKQMSSSWPPPSSQGSRERRYINFENRSSLNEPLCPERWRAELDEVLPVNSVVFSDIGAHMLFNIHHMTIRRDQRFVLNLGFGSMGHGTSAPIGAALAQPERPIFAVIGDGCFTMNGMELLTAVEYNVPVIWIVENNQMHGVTWHGSKMVNGGRPMQSIVYEKKLKIASIAEAMGLTVFTVDKPGQMMEIVPRALALKSPVLIEVCPDPMVSPPLGDRAKTVAGFKRE